MYNDSNPDRPSEFIQSEFLKAKSPHEGYDHPVEPRSRSDAVEDIACEALEDRLER